MQQLHVIFVLLDVDDNAGLAGRDLNACCGNERDVWGRSTAGGELWRRGGAARERDLADMMYFCGQSSIQRIYHELDTTKTS